MKLSFDDEESFKEAAGSLCSNTPPSVPNTPQQLEVGSSSSSSMSPQERGEEFCFNDPLDDMNTLALRRMGSSSSMLPGPAPRTRTRIRSEDT